MSTSGLRNLDGELLLSAAITRDCGHVRARDIGPIWYLETYRRDLVGSLERCGGCPGTGHARRTGLLWSIRTGASRRLNCGESER